LLKSDVGHGFQAGNGILAIDLPSRSAIGREPGRRRCPLLVSQSAVALAQPEGVQVARADVARTKLARPDLFQAAPSAVETTPYDRLEPRRGGHVCLRRRNLGGMRCYIRDSRDLIRSWSMPEAQQPERARARWAHADLAR
jgi:hypothetical protein